MIFWSFVLFTVSVKTHFWASHQLVLPDSSKEPVHGHNWSVTANVSGEFNSAGLIIDFCRLKAMVDEVIAEFGSMALEEVDYFQRNSSSAENVARYIYEKLEHKLPDGVKLSHIRVGEEPGCWAKFSK